MDEKDEKITRRDFIKTTGGTLAMTAIGADTLTNMANAAENKTEDKGKMEKRQYGSKEDKLSIIGFGGIIVMSVPQEDANAYVSEAIEKDIN